MESLTGKSYFISPERYYLRARASRDRMNSRLWRNGAISELQSRVKCHLRKSWWDGDVWLACRIDHLITVAIRAIFMSWIHGMITCTVILRVNHTYGHYRFDDEAILASDWLP